MVRSEDFTTEVTCLWCTQHHAPQLSPLPGLCFLLSIPKTLSGSESSLPSTLSLNFYLFPAWVQPSYFVYLFPRPRRFFINRLFFFFLMYQMSED